ncbi:MAG TPA: primosomal protein N' [Halothiobacillus sp.]|nr:primosomal protein N' [Halothiobacillus sp.]
MPRLGKEEADHALGALTDESCVGPTWSVALPGPLPRLFSYSVPDVCHPAPGVRVRVPFGRGHRVGVLWAPVSAEPGLALKPVDGQLDKAPLLDATLLDCIAWAASYYHYPLGEAVLAAFPPALRKGGLLSRPGLRLTATGGDILLAKGVRGSRQRQLLQMLAAHPPGLAESELTQFAHAVRQSVLVKEWAERVALPLATGAFQKSAIEPASPKPLNTAQQSAVAAVAADWARFQVWLLDGVTGSGKTEVYLSLIEQVTSAGKQVLVLVPEIALTPQLVARFAAHLRVALVVLHSGLSESDRLQGWIAAQSGAAKVVIGTRSAAFQPLANLGLVIVDEEHDPSLKQNEGFGFHARDVAIWRARSLNIPIVLGSATPALESLRNVQLNRYRGLSLPDRAGGARLPVITPVDVRGQRMTGGLSVTLIEAVEQHLLAGGQVLLYLNRRGYAPSLLCHACGWVAACLHCDAFMTWHRQSHRLKCHHCGHERAVPSSCPDCQTTLSPRGLGTEQLEDVLAGLFPDFGIERLDRDVLGRKGELDRRLARIRSGEARLIVGTQILVKGHDFPEVSLVGVVDADQGLFANDFRGSERFAQQLIQVAGRAGRADRLGTVLVQTHHPDHPGLNLLLRGGYGVFAGRLIQERAEAGLPPMRSSALIRADGPDAAPPQGLLETMANGLSTDEWAGLSVWGPVEAPLARRAGRFRYQLLLLAEDRGLLHDALSHLDEWIGTRRLSGVRWSIDVDPLDMA